MFWGVCDTETKFNLSSSGRTLLSGNEHRESDYCAVLQEVYSKTMYSLSCFAKGVVKIPWDLDDTIWALYHLHPEMKPLKLRKG